MKTRIKVIDKGIDSIGTYDIEYQPQVKTFLFWDDLGSYTIGKLPTFFWYPSSFRTLEEAEQCLVDYVRRKATKISYKEGPK